jgi:hypothetical protein
MQFPLRFLAYLLARFSEPSSYAGLGAVLALLGVHFSDSLTGQIAQSLAALCALAALLLKERGIVKSLALIGILAAGATLAACAPVATTKTDDPAPIAGPYAVWIDAGCGTAEAA